jgi:flagellar assembly protein FliH
MRKWSPEPLVPEPEAAGAFVPHTVASPGSVRDDRDDSRRRFRSEVGFADGPTLMAELTADERAQLYEMVEMEVKRDYEARLRRLEAEQSEARAAELAELDGRAERWRRELAEGVQAAREDLHRSLAREAVDLALAVAAKVVRRHVALDRDVLVRALETVLYRLEAGATMDVTVSEEDGRRLVDDPELRRELRIREVKVDRRIDPGGCLVRADGGEWDATVDRQLETIGEVVQESLQVVRESDPDDDPDTEDHGPGLE